MYEGLARRTEGQLSTAAQLEARVRCEAQRRPRESRDPAMEPRRAPPGAARVGQRHSLRQLASCPMLSSGDAGTQVRGGQMRVAGQIDWRLRSNLTDDCRSIKGAVNIGSHTCIPLSDWQFDGYIRQLSVRASGPPELVCAEIWHAHVGPCLAAYPWWYGGPLGSSEHSRGGLGTT